MRMGLATFLPARNGLLDGEAPSTVDLMTRFEEAMAGRVPISLHEVMADLLSAPPPLQESRTLRCLQAWLLGPRSHMGGDPFSTGGRGSSPWRWRLLLRPNT